MSESFDPYRKWLGIAPHEQPPHHYRLLGIAPFEDDPDVIENAADRQMAHVRTFQGGRHKALSQKILNELSAAKVALLDPAKKAAYDVQLHEQLLGAETAPPPAEVAGPPAPAPAPAPVAVPVAVQPVAPPPASGPVATAPVVSRPVRSAASSKRSRRRETPLVPILIGLTVAGVILAGLLIFVMTQGDDELSGVVPPAASKSSKISDKATSGDKKQRDTKSDSLVAPKIDVAPPMTNAATAAIQDARQAVERRDLAAAKAALDKAFAAQPGDLEEQQITQLRTLIGYVEDFWKAAREGLQRRVQPGDVLMVDDRELELVTLNGERVTYKLAGSERTQDIAQLPTAVAVAFAKAGFAPERPRDTVRIGAFWALDGATPLTNRLAQAKACWVAAAEKGEQDMALAGELQLDAEFIASIQPKQDEPIKAPDLGVKPGEGETGLFERGPVPTDEELRAARERFRTRYGDDQARAKSRPEDYEVFLHKLMGEAQQERDVPLRYVMYLQALEAAVSVIRPDRIVDITNDMARQWEIDDLKQKQQYLVRCRPVSTTSAETTFNVAQGVMQEAIDAGRLDLAISLGNLGVRVGDKIKGPEVKALQAKVRELVAEQDAADKARQAEAALAQDPSDANAHGNLGRYLCYFQGDWSQGLPHLAQAAAGEESQLAADDLAQPTDPAKQWELAQGWYQQAKRKAGPPRVACLKRANEWLDRALPALSGDNRTAAERLQKDVAKDLGMAN